MNLKCNTDEIEDYIVNIEGYIDNTSLILDSSSAEPRLSFSIGMSGNKMSDFKMSDSKMSDHKMSDHEMSDHEMSDHKMSDGKIMSFRFEFKLPTFTS